MHALKAFTRRFLVFLLTLEAKAVLKRFSPHIIAVTGSVGKTSTKDAVYTALAGSYFVRKSEKSFNSDIGVPLTILGVPNGWSNPFQWLKNLADGFSLLLLRPVYPAWLVIEVGADRPGDISRSLTWLSPDIVVATRFPDVSVHVEYYASPEDVVKEELAPAAWLGSGGAYVYNHDDAKAAAAITFEDVRRISFGFGEGADVRATHLRYTGVKKTATGISFDIAYGDERTHVVMKGVLGAAHAYAVIGGVAAALAAGVPLVRAVADIESHVPPPGRMRLIEGRNGSVVIDDTYNASPAATEEALSALAAAPRIGKRIAVLADMLELGSYSVDEHRRIGALAAESTELLVTVGVRARNLAEAAIASGLDPSRVLSLDSGTDVAAQMPALVEAGDIVLVKGSQSMRMEKVVKALMANPADAKRLLVRQDEEWERR